MMKLNAEQLKAVRFYEGDVEGSDPYWSDPKAYVTINSLFYDGISTEVKRTNEGKKLNPAILEDEERLLKTLSDLMNAMKNVDLNKIRHTFRVERYADYLSMKDHGGTVSFTSTSTNGFLKSYADRHGIALMIFTIPENIPCFPYEETLGELYFKKEEHETLLPPGLKIEFNEIELSEEDKEIRDDHNEPPIVKCEARIKGHLTYKVSEEDIIKSKNIDIKELTSRLYPILNNKGTPDKKDVDDYALWKRVFVSKLLNQIN